MTLEEAKKALERAKDVQYTHECGNDMYYSSHQYQEDKEDIEYWENKVKELEKANETL